MMTYTKQMSKENKEMTKLAKELLATRNCNPGGQE
jgi:hypothetical protein